MIKWQHKKFSQLTVDELFEILRLRQEVFIIEQQCIYPDIDDVDKAASHLYVRCEKDKHIKAYLRIVPPGVKFPEASFGRVLTSQAARGSGVGKAVVIEALDRVSIEYPGQKIKIGAQVYLERFYKELGFRTISKPYDEDGIMHIDMLYEPK